VTHDLSAIPNKAQNILLSYQSACYHQIKMKTGELMSDIFILPVFKAIEQNICLALKACFRVQAFLEMCFRTQDG